MFTKWFDRVASWTAWAVGTAPAFVGSVALVLAWGLLWPVFNWSDTWQLVINTVTTIITFWIVFLIQNSQNRGDLALHLKLDELIQASRARNRMMRIEELSEEELLALKRTYRPE